MFRFDSERHPGAAGLQDWKAPDSGAVNESTGDLTAVQLDALTAEMEALGFDPIFRRVVRKTANDFGAGELSELAGVIAVLEQFKTQDGFSNLSGDSTSLFEAHLAALKQLQISLAERRRKLMDGGE